MNAPKSRADDSAGDDPVGDSEAQRRTLTRLRFPPALETAFRDDHERKVLPGLRGALLLLLALFLLQGVTALVLYHRVILSDWVSSVAIFALMAATRDPRFPAIWQPMIVVTFCLLAYQRLDAVSGIAPAGIQGNASIGAFRANTLLLNEVSIIIVGCALTRLRFAWFAAGTVVIFTLTTVVAFRIPGLPLSLFFGGTEIFVVPSLCALLMVAYLQERSARAEFLANHRLAEERNDERRGRERTEGMLHVLGQAIGGIVHDLGNPLTSVRTGAETLRALGADEETDRALEGEILDIISEGALMLDYLRLSLLEQTRVLEGKPIPLQCAPVPIRHVVEAGSHYQKPKFASGRKISMAGDDLVVRADGAKLITVFMNLLGNALKYSDGEIRVSWQPCSDAVVCAVLDQGRGGVGLSRAQARQLFVPFGRLDAHAGVEGTGLGLLSAQKIMEAHGGEVFIEGCGDGTSKSTPFTTARGAYPSMLEEGFRTAFIVTCPLAPMSQQLQVA